MEYLDKVPNVVWAAIIASLLTLMGVMLTNRGNRKSLGMQLDHDKYKFLYEQDIALKKEVFLEAAESFSKSISVIPKMSGLENSIESISKDVEAHSASSAKLYLIAKQDAVSKAIEFSNEISESFLALLKDRYVLDDMKKAVDIYQNAINLSVSEQKRIIGVMKELNISGNATKDKIDYLSDCYDLEKNHIDENQSSIESIRQKMTPMIVEYSKVCLAEYSRLSILLSPLIMLVRSELHTSESEGDFDEIVRASTSRMQRSYENFLQSISSNE